VADDGAPILFGFMDRATVFLSSNGACQMLGVAGLGLVARRVDKRPLAALKTGSVVAGVRLPLFLAWFGFVRGVAQTPAAALGILLAFSIGPGVFAVLKVVALWMYPLGQGQVDRIERELRERRAGPAAPVAG
jgi:hypothetical protein